LPQCTAEFLVLLFYDVGLCGQGANGATAISWQEIESWKRVTDQRITPWEADMLHKMSEAYVHEVHAGSERTRPMPFVEDIKRDKVKQAQLMEDFFEIMLFQQNSKNINVEE
jgi:hypothetical protein